MWTMNEDEKKERGEGEVEGSGVFLWMRKKGASESVRLKRVHKAGDSAVWKGQKVKEKAMSQR